VFFFFLNATLFREARGFGIKTFLDVSCKIEY